MLTGDQTPRQTYLTFALVFLSFVIADIALAVKMRNGRAELWELIFSLTVTLILLIYLIANWRILKDED